VETSIHWVDLWVPLLLLGYIAATAVFFATRER